MKKIAITGGIGSGKSTVAAIFKEWGYAVFSCDEIYKEVIRMPKYVQKVKKLFPSAVINGEIDRKILSELIFSKEENRNALNQVAHPLIMETLNARMNTCPNDCVFAEVPLLFEGNFEHLFDKIIVVNRSKESRVSALLERDKSTRENIERRIAVQFDYHSEEGRKRLNACNVIEIDNDKTLEELKKQLKNVIPKLK